jgi:hypothetical protein
MNSTDTLNVINESLNGIELLSQLNAFYESAWNKLVLFGSILIALLGFAIPYYTGHFQKKQFNILETNLLNRESELKKQISFDLAKLKMEQKEEFAKELAEKISQFEEKANLIGLRAEAKAIHIQANVNHDKKFYSLALDDYLYALDAYIESDDSQSVQRVLNAITENLKKLSKTQLNSIKNMGGNDLSKSLEKLEKYNAKQRNMYEFQIRAIKHEIEIMPEVRLESALNL